MVPQHLCPHLVLPISLLFFSALFPLAISTPNSRITVLVSQTTPTPLISDLIDLEKTFQYPLKVVRIEEVNSILEVSGSSEVVVDFLYNEFWSSYLADASSARTVLCGNKYNCMTHRHLFGPREADFFAISQVARWLELDHIALFLSECNKEKSVFLECIPEIPVEFLYISDSFEAETARRLLRKQVKPQGIKSIIVCLPIQATLALIQALKETEFEYRFTNVILCKESAFVLMTSDWEMPGSLRWGPLFLIDAGCEAVRSSTEFLACKLTQSIENDHDQLGWSHSVMSLESSQREVIGKVADRSLSMRESLKLYRESHPRSAIATLTISHNNGTMNPSGESGTSEKFDFVGVNIAASDINQDMEVLPYHRLQVCNVSLGLFEFDFEWAKKQLAVVPRSNLGLAMITGMYSSVAMNVYRLLNSQNYTLPQVGGTNTVPWLSSKKEFPLYTRVAMSDAYMSVLYGRMMQHYGWRHVTMLYCDELWSKQLYEMIVSETSKLGIETSNKETLRKLPAEMIGNYSDYLDVYQNIIDTNVRIVILLLYGQTLYRSLEALYDLGMRRGDLLFLATEWLDPSIFEVEDPILRGKIKELCHGAVQFYPATKIGDIGVRMSREYRDLMNRDASFYSCFYYDATYLIAHALDFLIMRGENYTCAYTLSHAIRNTRFRGCTGIVTITEGSNDRFPMMYDILNAQIAANGSYAIKRVGTYDPAGLVLFNFSSPILWPDNTTSTPLDMRGNIDCPFEEKDREQHTMGFIVECLTVSLSILLAEVFLAIVWKTRWNKKAERMLSRAEISFDDYIHFATIGIEAVQYASLGLDIPSWTFLFSIISNGLALNLSEITSLKNGRFWLLVNAIIVAALMWVALIIVLKFKLGEKCGCLCARLEEIGEMLLPLLGNLCFLPIVCTLLSVFECEEAVSRTHSPTLADTILLQDCYEGCWKFPHTAYVVCCSVLLLLYLPSAILLRPFWQFRQPYLHISTSPSYLMLKTSYQLLLVLLSKTVKRVSYICHSVLFITSSLSFLIISLFSKPYGYGRSNLWHYISLFCLLWMAFLSLLSEFIASGSAVTWASLFFPVFFLILLFGILWQLFKIPSMLYRRKGVHVVELFHFMFSQGSKYLHIFRPRDSLPSQGQTHGSYRTPSTAFMISP